MPIGMIVGADTLDTASIDGYIANATTGITVSTSVATTGSSGTNANLQPYVVVKMWKRTA